MVGRKVAVIGTGMTKFGELWDKSLRDIALEAAINAINDSGVEGKDIDALYIGNMSAGRFTGQEHLGALAADMGGLRGIPATRVEGACASGSLAIREAFLGIKAGLYDVVLVLGAEKMTDVSGEQATTTLGAAADQMWELQFGATFPSLYAMMARYHMHKYGSTIEQLSKIAVKSHEMGALNPYAQFRMKVSLEAVMNSTPVADPLRILHCSPITDGASAVILASEEAAKKFTDDPIWIVGSALATDTIALHDREDLASVWAAKKAAKEAYKMAGVTVDDINIFEVHDCFSNAELMAYEDLGIASKGQGGKAIDEGIVTRHGDKPVNMSGGLKAKGHPVGATGVAQIAEITTQLRGKAGDRQIPDVEIGLTHNVGGSGATAVIHILRR